MEYDIQAIQVLRNLVQAKMNVRCPKKWIFRSSSRNFGPLGISLQFTLALHCKYPIMHKLIGNQAGKNAKSSFRTLHVRLSVHQIS